MEKTIGVGILGGTGYGAGELLRLLLAHPDVEVLSVVSSSAAGERLAQAHRFLEGFSAAVFDAEFPWERFKRFRSRVIFASLPHGTSAEKIGEMAGELRQRGIKLIDLSGDFRLRDPANRRRFYGGGERMLGEQFVYGLSELQREAIRKANFIANPGCLASAGALALAPLGTLVQNGMIAIDAKTGTSGGGKSPAPVFHHPSRHASITAYKVLEHRHEPEIEQALADAGFVSPELFFVPHLIPISRGIFITAYLTLEREAGTTELLELYNRYYAGSPFVRVRTAPPELSDVVGSNFCDVSVVGRGKQVVAMAALDNLVKGMAGQAIQNMNISCGVEETAGLWQPSLGLV